MKRLLWLLPVRSLPASATPWGRLLALLLLLAAVPGCKLVELKMPGEPLSKEDFGLRGQTREFAKLLGGTVQLTADAIAAQSTDPAVRTRCVEWKIGAMNAVRSATLRSSPKLALVDAWALCRQMDDFLAPGGAGAALFGPLQGMALTNSQALEQRLAGTARILLSSSEYSRMDKFLTGFVAKYPLRSLAFNREPVVTHWEDFAGKPTVNPPAGTGSEALSDVAERLQIMGEQVPEELRWRLSLEQDVFAAEWARTGVTFERLDAALKQVGDAAAASPAALTNAVVELRTAFLPAFDRFQSEWTNTTRTLQTERLALTATLATERAAVLKDLSQQRAAMMQETHAMLQDLTDRSLIHVHAIIRDTLFYGVLLVGIILGLPFLFGFFVGRTWTRLRAPKNGGKSGPA